MEKRRSRLETTLEVLSAVINGIDKPTRIMYAVNMSWRPTQSILSSLVDQGLLTMKETLGRGRSKRSYGITEKGTNILRYFDGLKEIIEV